MILGSALYASAHIMPGQSKGTLQSYGMGMIIGGVIGVIIAVLLPYIFSLITGNTINTYTAICQTPTTLPSNELYIIYNGNIYSEMGINVNWIYFGNSCKYHGSAVNPSSILIHYPGFVNGGSAPEANIIPNYADYSTNGTMIGGQASDGYYYGYLYNFCYWFKVNDPD
jgi:hypothetical protein